MIKSHIFFISFLIFSGLHTCADEFKFPKAEKVSVVEEIHGVSVKDSFRWLEDLNSEKTRRFIEDEKHYYENQIDKKEAEKIFLKMKTELDLHEKKNLNKEGYQEYKKVKSGRQFLFKEVKDNNLLFRKDPGDERILPLIDLRGKIDKLQRFYISPTGKYVAYISSIQGGDKQLYVVNAETGKLLDDKFCGRDHQYVIWMDDDESFYYTAKHEDSEKYFPSVFWHCLHDNKTDKKVFYDDNNERYFHLTHRFKFSDDIFFYKYTRPYRELYVLKNEQIIPIATGKGYFTLVFQDNEKFYFVKEVSETYPNGVIFEVSTGDTLKSNWKMFIPYSEYVIESFKAINKHYFLTYKINGKNVIKIYNSNGAYLKDLSVKNSPNVSVWGDWDSQNVEVTYQTYATPEREYLYDINTEHIEYNQDGNNIDNEIINKQVWYKSKDGTRIPMVLEGKKSLLESRNPEKVIMFVYGGFKTEIEVFYNIGYKWLVDNDYILAFPSLRGSDEFGEMWWKQATKMGKQKTYDDCISAIEFLINENICTKEKMVLQGESNGGLTVSAVLTQKPELISIAIVKKPLTDMVRYVNFGNGKSWISEFGDPAVKEEFDVLYSYSPYHHLCNEKKYPDVILVAVLNDTLTGLEHALKFTAALQNVSNGEVLLQMREDEGHGSFTNSINSLSYDSIIFAYLAKKIK